MNSINNQKFIQNQYPPYLFNVKKYKNLFKNKNP